MKQLFKESKKRIFFRLFISHFLIIIIPLVACSVVYTESVNMETYAAKSQNNLMLSQVKDILDGRLEEIQSISNQIVTNKRVIPVLNIHNYKEGSPDFYRVWDLCDNMPNYRLTNHMILELHIFCKNSNIVINSDSAYCGMDALYGKAFSYGDLNYSGWSKLLYSGFYNGRYFPSTKIKINDTSYSAFCYMQSLPYDNASNAQGVLTILIDEGPIKNMLERFNIGKTGMVFIADSEGKLISSLSGENCKITPSEIQSAIEKKNTNLPEKVVISSVKSEMNGWKYVSVIPEDLVLAKVKFIKTITLIMFLVSLAAGGLAAFLLTYRKASILAKVTDKCKGISDSGSNEDKNSEPFKFIDKAVSELIHNNMELENRVKEQMPLLKAAALRRLLFGEVQDEVEENVNGIFSLENNPDILVINIYTVTEEVIGTYPEYSKNNVFIKETINHSGLPQHYLLDINRKIIALLVVLEDTGHELAIRNINETLEKILTQLEGSLKINVRFAVSEIHHGVRSANNAFEESNDVIDYMKYVREKSIIWYSEIPKNSELYYYPVDLELRLIGLIKSGDTANVKQILSKIHEENFVRRHLSSEMIHQLIYSMKGTVMRGLKGMSYDQSVRNEIEELDKASTIDEIFNFVIRANVNINMAMNDLKMKNQNTLKKNISDYIEKHYSQSNLTLEMLASDLGYSVPFTYQFFKEVIGASFADYLEKKRIDQACEYLSKTNLVIKDIALKAGYNSDNSFRRAFKRIIGVSPCEYAHAVNAESKVSSQK